MPIPVLRISEKQSKLLSDGRCLGEMCYTCITSNTFREEDPMITARLPEDLEARLEKLTNQTGRKKSYYIRAALQEYLDNHEDYLLALARLEKKNPKLSLEEMEKRLGLDDSD